MAPSSSMIARRLIALDGGPAFGNEDDAGVEIALLAGDALIDGVGDHMGDAPPVLRRGEELLAQHLAFADRRPTGGNRPAAGRRAAASPGRSPAPCALITRQLAKLGTHVDVGDVLDEGLGIERLEQAGALQIGAHHAGDIGAGLGVGSPARKSGMAMGRGWILPWVTSTCSAAQAGEATPPAKPPMRRRGPTISSCQFSSEYQVINMAPTWQPSYCPIIWRGSKRKGLISRHWL